MLDFLFKPLFEFQTCVSDICYTEPTSAMFMPVSLIILGCGIAGMIGCFSLYNRIQERKDKKEPDF